jgi:hypothetical protein
MSRRGFPANVGRFRGITPATLRHGDAREHDGGGERDGRTEFLTEQEHSPHERQRRLRELEPARPPRRPASRKRRKAPVGFWNSGCTATTRAPVRANLRVGALATLGSALAHRREIAVDAVSATFGPHALAVRFVLTYPGNAIGYGVAGALIPLLLGRTDRDRAIGLGVGLALSVLAVTVLWGLAEALVLLAS